MINGPIILTVVFIALYAAFLVWYGGRAKPLSKEEVDTLLAEMQKRAGKKVQTEEEAPILEDPQGERGSLWKAHFNASGSRLSV